MKIIFGFLAVVALAAAAEEFELQVVQGADRAGGQGDGLGQVGAVVEQRGSAPDGQGQIDSRLGAVGAEVLLRWHHPDGSIWTADRFVAIAEKRKAPPQSIRTILSPGNTNALSRE